MRQLRSQNSPEQTKRAQVKETEAKAETEFARLFKEAELARKALASRILVKNKPAAELPKKLLPKDSGATTESGLARLFKEAELARKALASRMLAKNKPTTELPNNLLVKDSEVKTESGLAKLFREAGRARKALASRMLAKDSENTVEAELTNGLEAQLPPQEEANSYVSERPNNYLIAEFKRNGVNSLWHMTHVDNVQSIINSGILSHSDAHAKISVTDISNNEVNTRRRRREPLFSRKIHDYAPLYINIRNPMLYVKKDINDELCLLEISLSVLEEESCIYTDGNAAADATCFYHGADNVKDLPWEVLNANYWNDIPDGRRKRCAEVLVLDKIEPRHIKAIHCYSIDTAEILSSRNIRASVSQQFFF